MPQLLRAAGCAGAYHTAEVATAGLTRIDATHAKSALAENWAAKRPDSARRHTASLWSGDSLPPSGFEPDADTIAIDCCRNLTGWTRV